MNQSPSLMGCDLHWGTKTFEILYRARTTIALVSESEIAEATKMVWEHMKIVVEPSSAVTLAAILRHPRLVKKRVGVVLSGGNVAFPAIFQGLK